MQRCLALHVVLVVLTLALPGLAQVTQGNIQGILTDPTGAAVAGVNVRVVNRDTQVSSTTATNEEGFYRVQNLNPGFYSVQFEAAGFKRVIENDVQVRSTETARIDRQLEVGAVTESVEVSAAAQLLETETSTVGHVVTGYTRNKLPNPQQKIQSILWMMPGVTSQGGPGGNVAGQRTRAFVTNLEGVSAMEPVRGEVATNRFLATVEQNMEEIKVLTTALPAEYGHSGGGVMNITYKSGTNDLHGLAEERYLGRQMIHRNWQDAAIPRNTFGYHMITGQLSGPVYIPKIYNGRNRTFFLFGWQRHHEKASEDLRYNVPNADMYNGNFNFGGQGFPIFDPASTTQLADGTWSRTQFPGNVIPRNRFDPSAQRLLGFNPFRPESNRFNQAFIDRTGPVQNLSMDSTFRSYRTGTDYKIDHSFSNSHKMFARVSNYRHRSFQGRWQDGIGNRLFDYNVTPIPIDQTQMAVSDTITISPTMVNEFRFGSNRRKYTRTPETLDQNWAGQIGIPGVGPQTFPSLLTQTGANMFGLRWPEGRELDVTEAFTLQNNLTMIRGKHTFKGGYELMRTRANSLIPVQPSGRYFFGATDFPFRPNTGHPFASFLLGSVVQAEYTQALASWLPRWWTNSFYFQDDWKVTRTLTLNLGVRYQYETPFNTKYGQHSQFDPTATDPLTGRNGGITHPRARLSRPDRNNFQPRIGMAWNFSKRWVWRAGFAVNTLDVWTNGLRQNFDEYTAVANVQPPPGDPRVAFYLSQGPGAITYNTLPNGTAPFSGRNFGARPASLIDPNMRAPYVLNWNAGFQYQLSSDIVVEATYQGSSGVGLLGNWDINQIPLNVSTDTARLTDIFRAAQNFRPFPHFGTINMFSNFGHNSFHSGTVKIDKRFRNGWSLTSFYTWSRAIDEASTDGGANGLDYFNRRLEKGRSNYDVGHRWVTFALYDLPFGKGRKWLAGSNRVINGIFGGWQAGLINTYEEGAPFSFSVAASPNLYLAANAGAGLPRLQRPDMAPGRDYDSIRRDWDRRGPCRHIVACAEPWMDLSAFRYPDSFRAGNMGRNVLSGPGLFYQQTTLSKTMAIKERVRGTLRLDINNPFKIPFFTAPNAAVNFVNPQAFGKITSTQGSFSGQGGRTYLIAIFTLQF